MATSTNYGWAEPDNSSLVKNGASDIRTLGNAIDTSVWNVGFGQAGKNKIINGDFTFNQRAFTSNTTTLAYNFDRWLQQNSGGTFTVTPQTFTAGAAPVAGYEATNYVQGVTATQSAAGDFAIITQRIENVRTFAGNSITISFYAKANTGTPKIGIEVQQNFGSGGSPSAAVSTPAGAVTLTTSWARYSVTVAVPSISGKTIGSTANSSYLELNLWTSAGATYATRASSVGVQNFTASIWGVQAEYGLLATPFQIATGTLATELVACQRYYWRWNALSVFATLGVGTATSTTVVAATVYHPVPMRTTVSAIDGSSNANFRLHDWTAGYTQTGASIEVAVVDLFKSTLNVTVAAGLTLYRDYYYGANNTTSAYLGFSAEL
jgi:hypothetical protein